MTRVLRGKETEIPSEQRTYVDAGPIWRSSAAEIDVRVHSPLHRGGHVVYAVTTYFPLADGREPRTVLRRYSHFIPVARILERTLGLIVLPPLPGKKILASSAFLESRARDLTRWLSRVVRHPVARVAPAVRALLELEEDEVRPRSTWCMLRCSSSRPRCLDCSRTPGPRRPSSAVSTTTAAISSTSTRLRLRSLASLCIRRPPSAPARCSSWPSPSAGTARASAVRARDRSNTI